MYGGMNGADNVTFNDMYELRTGECDAAGWCGPSQVGHTHELHTPPVVAKMKVLCVLSVCNAQAFTQLVSDSSRAYSSAPGVVLTTLVVVPLLDY